MSRIGKKTITVPQGVTVTAETGKVTVKGQKGETSLAIPQGITVTVDDSKVSVAREGEERHLCEMHGTIRATIVNMIAGVKDGYQKGLEMVGVGYRAEVKANKLYLYIGWTKPAEVEIPKGITCAVDQNTKISVSGISLDQVGVLAAKIRSICPPEPYGGKGIRYAGENVRHKAGKSVAGK
ncbi:50S ribosomal protein L6 [bacterium]|nr:50S ribosomal protein L6 [bacterium]